MANGAQEPLLISVSLNQAQAREFLRKLGEDDAYRRRLKNNPQKALAEFGILVPKSALPDEVTLPPKDDVQNELRGTRKSAAGPEPRVVPFAPCLMWGLVYLAASRAKPPGRSRRRAS